MMTDQLTNISRLEKDLWEAADNLRANSKLTSTEYCMPVLGVIFLRHAANRFDAVTQELHAAQASGKMPKRKLIPQDYVKRRSLWLPKESQYDYILNLPSDADLGEAVIGAMDKVEESFEPLQGVLPKEYSIFERTVLEDLLRTFDRESLRAASGDVFGRIYEYFLMKFAMQGAQDNGEFFTPPSIVQTIVNVIEPKRGKVLDPAVGSAGMFVQSSHFVERRGQDASHNLTFYGQEKTATTIRLAKMNLAVHGLEGDIREANTFYDDVHSLVGKCDYVMANPPFNVDMVDAEKIKGDARLPFGLPGINKKKKVSNANYLWIQYFYSYLNDKGRSGFVMASGAETASGEEQTIRQKLIATGHVDVMIAIDNNFFYTRQVPCVLWFLDKAKSAERHNQVLMIDARNIHRKVTRVIKDFSPEQLMNITSIVWLYRGETDRFLGLIRTYLSRTCETAVELQRIIAEFSVRADELVTHLRSYGKSLAVGNGEDKEAISEYKATVVELGDTLEAFKGEHSSLGANIEKHLKWVKCATLETNNAQHDAYDRFEPISNQIRLLRTMADRIIKAASTAHEIAIKRLSAPKSTEWATAEIRGLHKDLIRTSKEDEEESLRSVLENALKRPLHFHRQTHWLQSKFPMATFEDVVGLCKLVSLAEIEENDWALTPGRFVGVIPLEDDDEFDFEARMESLRTEIETLAANATKLSRAIGLGLRKLLK